jgi:hypothetical protein
MKIHAIYRPAATKAQGLNSRQRAAVLSCAIAQERLNRRCAIAWRPVDARGNPIPRVIGF